MAFYLRKYLQSGPVRLNISKGGLGLSGGVRGARIGISPRGTYLHAGRHGLYYRKHLSGQQQKSQPDEMIKGCMSLILAVIALIIVTYLFTWLMKHPEILIAILIFAVVLPIVYFSFLVYRKRLISNYKKTLDLELVSNLSLSDKTNLQFIRQKKEKLPKDKSSRKKINLIELNVYQAILDRVLDDKIVSEDEAAKIRMAERILSLDLESQVKIKKDIFTEAYLGAIQDHILTDKEMNMLNNLIEGLMIPRAELSREIEIIEEIREAQSLCLPLTPLPIDELEVKIQKNETAYYQNDAMVLTRLKSKEALSGYEYKVKRDGTLVVTDKRLFVVGGGTTNLRFSDIADLEVDIDERIIEVSKATSERPIIIQTATPFYVGKLVDLLMGTKLIED